MAYLPADDTPEQVKSLDAHRKTLQWGLWKFTRSKPSAMSQLWFLLTGVMVSLWVGVLSIHAFGLAYRKGLQLIGSAFVAWLGLFFWEYSSSLAIAAGPQRVAGFFSRLRRIQGAQNSTSSLIPVTIVTGFLGSGKTTLIKHILRDQHGKKILVVENEVGDVMVDHEILVQETEEEVVLLQNGCVCCSVRADLVRVLKASARCPCTF